jgi:hypothetical protein
VSPCGQSPNHVVRSLRTAFHLPHLGFGSTLQQPTCATQQEEIAGDHNHDNAQAARLSLEAKRTASIVPADKEVLTVI